MNPREVVAQELGLTRNRDNRVCVYCNDPNLVEGKILCGFPFGPGWRTDDGVYIGVYACGPCGRARIKAGTLRMVGLDVVDGRLIRGGKYGHTAGK